MQWVITDLYLIYRLFSSNSSYLTFCSKVRQAPRDEVQFFSTTTTTPPAIPFHRNYCYLFITIFNGHSRCSSSARFEFYILHRRLLHFDFFWFLCGPSVLYRRYDIQTVLLLPPSLDFHFCMKHPVNCSVPWVCFGSHGFNGVHRGFYQEDSALQPQFYADNTQLNDSCRLCGIYDLRHVLMMWSRGKPFVDNS
jgi:hypothetical protein